MALLNRGTPSSLVAPDGTLHIGLMRASSAWPCEVWIDGERRAAPDGSSFAWQHWSHTFEYALAAGAGDWRDAGFAAAGQEYSHDLLACETGVHPGPLPAAASLCEVTGPSAMLTALKPRGNPLASGLPGQPRREDGVTVRLRDAGGGREPAAASQVRLFTAPATARLTSLLEDADGPPLPLADGATEVAVPAAGTVTLALAGFGAWPAGNGATAIRQNGGPPEPAQPVFSRYWLHGKGPAPAGNLPVAVHLSPARVALAPIPGRASAGGASLRLTVACGPQPASGLVALDVPPGLVVEPAGLTGTAGTAGTAAAAGTAAPLRYELTGGGFACWELTARVLPGTPPGRYYVAARITDDLGQTLEDAALVTVGEPAAPPLDLPLDDLLPLIGADEQAAAAEVGLRLLPSSMTLSPGRPGEFSVEVTNRTAAPIRGECQLISPLGTWQALGPWTRGFAAQPGEDVTLCYPLRLPASARPGSHWWALAKVMYFGRIAYSECAGIEVGG